MTNERRVLPAYKPQLPTLPVQRFPSGTRCKSCALVSPCLGRTSKAAVIKMSNRQRAESGTNLLFRGTTTSEPGSRYVRVCTYTFASARY